MISVPEAPEAAVRVICSGSENVAASSAASHLVTTPGTHALPPHAPPPPTNPRGAVSKPQPRARAKSVPKTSYICGIPVEDYWVRVRNRLRDDGWRTALVDWKTAWYRFCVLEPSDTEPHGFIFMRGAPLELPPTIDGYKFDIQRARFFDRLNTEMHCAIAKIPTLEWCVFHDGNGKQRSVISFDDYLPLKPPFTDLTGCRAWATEFLAYAIRMGDHARSRTDLNKDNAIYDALAILERFSNILVTGLRGLLTQLP